MKALSKSALFLSALGIILTGLATYAPSATYADVQNSKVAIINDNKSAYAINVFSKRNCGGTRKIVRRGVDTVDGRSYKVNAYSRFRRVTAMSGSVDYSSLKYPNQCINANAWGGQFLIVTVYSNL